MSFSRFYTQKLEKVTLHQLNFHARFQKKEIQTKGQLILKGLIVIMNSSKKQTTKNQPTVL